MMVMNVGWMETLLFFKGFRSLKGLVLNDRQIAILNGRLGQGRHLSICIYVWTVQRRNREDGSLMAFELI